MGVYARAQEILACADYHCFAIIRWVAGIDAGVSGGTVYLYPLLMIAVLVDSG